jgi:hypothetical protein
LKLFRDIFIYGCLWFSAISAVSQKESTWWYFSRNAGVEFELGYPVADTNMNDSAVSYGLTGTDDITSISDSSGVLQFYASYTGVFNREHKSMPHGLLKVHRPNKPPLSFHAQIDKENISFFTLEQPIILEIHIQMELLVVHFITS